MDIQKLNKQKAELEAQIELAKRIEKKRSRVEKMVLKLLNKNPNVFLTDIKTVEEVLGKAMGSITTTADTPES